MAKKKITSAIKHFINLFFLVPSLFSLVVNLGRLIGYEARVAGRSLVLIIILFICLSLLLTSTWLCALVMLFFVLHTYFSVLTSLTAILALNLLLALLTALVMARVKENLLFPETREQVSSLVRIPKDS